MNFIRAHIQGTVCLLSLTALAAGTAFSGDPGKEEALKPWSICDVFDLATFYKGGEGAFIESLAMAGRLQADAVFFHEAPDREVDVLLWRRLREGFKAKFRGGFLLHAEADLDLNEMDPVYQRLTDAYLAWAPGDAFTLKVGKHSAPFTQDGKTSSTQLIRPERSLLSNNLWFPEEYFSGVSGGGKRNGWIYNIGIFSSSGGAEFGDFDAGNFGLLTIGRDFAKQAGLDKAVVAVDYVHNGRDRGNLGTRDMANVVSINGRFEQGDFGVWTDVEFGDGYFRQSDLFGLAIMPFYNLSKKWQLVGSYNFMTSDAPNGVRLDRYENFLESRRADSVHEFFAGVNYYLCGHKLKWQNGVEFTTADGAGEYDGWGYTSAMRMYW